MRRTVVVLAIVAVTGFGGVVMGRSTVKTGAQTDAPGNTAGHPLVGTWIVKDDGDTREAPSMSILTSDGIFIDISASGRVGSGAWEATGPRSGLATFVYVYQGQSGQFSGTGVIRTAIEVSETGDTVTANYSYTTVGPDGAVLNSVESTIHGVRMSVEPMENMGLALAIFPTVEDPVSGSPVP